jgi:hypothetical protein
MMNHKIIMRTGLVAALLLVFVGAQADEKSGEAISWQVISSGSTNSSSPNFGLLGTSGETSIGAGSSLNFGVSHGFWVTVIGGGCCSIRGDIDDNGTENPDIVDLIYLVTYMFQGGPEPVCMEATDINGDELPQPNIADLIHMVMFMFQEGPEIVPCR